MSLAVAQAKIAELPFDTHSLAWSADGRRIVCVVENPGFLGFGLGSLGNIAPSAIWVVPSAGGRAVQVTDTEHLNMSPVWMPDGKHLLFISNRSGRRDLYEIAAT